MQVLRCGVTKKVVDVLTLIRPGDVVRLRDDWGLYVDRDHFDGRSPLRATYGDVMLIIEGVASLNELGHTRFVRGIVSDLGIVLVQIGAVPKPKGFRRSATLSPVR